MSLGLNIECYSDVPFVYARIDWLSLFIVTLELWSDTRLGFDDSESDKMGHSRVTLLSLRATPKPKSCFTDEVCRFVIRPGMLAGLASSGIPDAAV